MCSCVGACISNYNRRTTSRKLQDLFSIIYIVTENSDYNNTSGDDKTVLVIVLKAL